MRPNIVSAVYRSIVSTLAPMVETAAVLERCAHAAVCAPTDRLPADGSHAPGARVMRVVVGVAAVTTSRSTNGRVLLGEPITASSLALIT